MCGIVGVVSRQGWHERPPLETMRETLRHRGPDDSGLWWSADGSVGLAMRRLAVIDLSPGGHQPMVDAEGRLALVFNGEIYNYRELRKELQERGHRFRSASDGEVILEAYRCWGSDCLSRLNGMFAFAIYDAREKVLLIARDRAGEKPLFYRAGRGAIAFASELKALLADPTCPRQLDPGGLSFYLAYGYVPGEQCILQGIQKLGAGQALRYELESDRLETFRYWQLPEPAPRAGGDREALAAELEALLLDSVRMRLLADVPLGILLSGGLDSSLVTAFAARAASGPVRTFTISFPGHGHYDEAPHAARVASHFGTSHTVLEAEPASVELLPKLAEQFDEPLADSSIVPTYLVSRLVRAQATVALGGDGGDELFAGYNHYNAMIRLGRLRPLVPRRLRGLAGTAAAHLLPVGLPGRNHFAAFGETTARSIAHVNLYFDTVARRRLLSPEISVDRGPEAYKEALCAETQSPLQQSTRVDFLTHLPDDFLVKVDRASMLASLEVRAPFLDHRLVEFAFGRVPDDLRAAGDDRKILLRQLAARVLPKGLDLKRKQGFSMPLHAWFQGSWGDFMVQVLSEADPHLFRPRAIRGLIAGQRWGFSNSARLFSLTLFELWRRHYRIALA